MVARALLLSARNDANEMISTFKLSSLNFLQPEVDDTSTSDIEPEGENAGVGVRHTQDERRATQSLP